MYLRRIGSQPDRLALRGSLAGADTGHDLLGSDEFFLAQAGEGAVQVRVRAELLHDGEPLVLTVPERIAGAGRGEEPVVDERAFAVALRQRVNAAVVHHATGTLPSGRRATASVRRRADGSLYSVTDPPRAGGDRGGRELDPDDVEALLALERRVRDGVGLPTP